MLILGKRLYPLIESSHPDLASKITAMLLEIDNAELLHMLESRESLKTTVEEAVAVLQAHEAKVVAQRNRQPAAAPAADRLASQISVTVGGGASSTKVVAQRNRQVSKVSICETKNRLGLIGPFIN